MRDARSTEPNLWRATTRRRLRMLVVGSDGATATMPLPDAGEVVIGRQEGCDLALPDPTVSRRHALLRISSELLLIDLGSSNGTYVEGRRLQEGEVAALRIGSSFMLGSATVLLQQAPTSKELRPVRTHDYFTARVEDECVRARAR